MERGVVAFAGVVGTTAREPMPAEPDDGPEPEPSSGCLPFFRKRRRGLYSGSASSESTGPQSNSQNSNSCPER